MNYEETHNDLWDVGINDDKFAMIAKLDEHADVVVKTPCGTTDKFELEKAIMQGTVFAPIKCSIQIDTLGRDCLANGDGLYQYKNMVDVPGLSMVDDLIGVSTCSDEAVKLNAIINVKIESKKLRFSHTKCFKLHIGKKVSQCTHNLKSHEENIKVVEKAVYLGDILNKDGTLDDTIADRKDKSIGKISQITTILSSITFGVFYMDTALILREAMLLNGIMTNSEIWYTVKDHHIKTLESADNDLLRKIFNAHSKTAIELLFLETAKIPIKFIISKRRLLYLWTLLKHKANELTHKVYNAQKTIQTKGDWFLMLDEERKKYKIELTDEEISKMSKYRFKVLVNKKVNYFAFNYLKEKASGHEKSLKIFNEINNNSVMKRAGYLKENMFSKSDCQLLFMLRSMMLDVKSNFSNLYQNDLSCRTCSDEGVVENEQHLLQCKMLKSELSDPEVKFEFVFQNLDKQKVALAAFKAVLRKREVILKYQENL